MARTDVIIGELLEDARRGRGPTQTWIDPLLMDARCVSVITAAELLAGSRNQREKRRIERELTLYETLWLNENVSRSALELYRRFHLSQRAVFFDGRHLSSLYCLLIACRLMVSLF
ncbi:MAG: hypothetical protein ACT4QE_06900 [Anaerolineales bacterium]